MSADNWAICPECEIKVKAHQVDLRTKAEKAYGTVSPEQYLDMIKNIDDDVELPNDLREDYKVGMDGDEFYVHYSGVCITCGWGFKFDHTEKVK